MGERVLWRVAIEREWGDGEREVEVLYCRARDAAAALAWGGELAGVGMVSVARAGGGDLAGRPDEGDAMNGNRGQGRWWRAAVTTSDGRFVRLDAIWATDEEDAIERARRTAELLYGGWLAVAVLGDDELPF